MCEPESQCSNAKTPNCRKFDDRWKLLFKPWLTRQDDVQTLKPKAFCICCDLSLCCNKVHLATHAATKKHRNNMMLHFPAELPRKVLEDLVPKNAQIRKCEKCHKVFDNAKYLYQHQRNAHSDSSYKCNICHNNFKYLNNLRRHEQLCHIQPPPEPFECNVCNKVFVQKYNLKTHQLIHNDPTFKCSLCHKAFHQSGNFKRHERKCRQKSVDRLNEKEVQQAEPAALPYYKSDQFSALFDDTANTFNTSSPSYENCDSSNYQEFEPEILIDIKNEEPAELLDYAREQFSTLLKDTTHAIKINNLRPGNRKCGSSYRQELEFELLIDIKKEERAELLDYAKEQFNTVLNETTNSINTTNANNATNIIDALSPGNENCGSSNHKEFEHEILLDIKSEEPGELMYCSREQFCALLDDPPNTINTTNAINTDSSPPRNENCGSLNHQEFEHDISIDIKNEEPAELLDCTGEQFSAPLDVTTNTINSSNYEEFEQELLINIKNEEPTELLDYTTEQFCVLLDETTGTINTTNTIDTISPKIENFGNSNNQELELERVIDIKNEEPADLLDYARQQFSAVLGDIDNTIILSDKKTKKKYH